MADIDRSEQYKASEIARIYDETRQKAQNLLDEERDRLEVELRAARRGAFQPTLAGARDSATLWSAYRECLDRAKKLNSPNEVREAMSESFLLGDDLMSRALLFRAFSIGDSKSVKMFLDEHPEDQKNYDQFVQASEEWNQFEKSSLFFGLSRFRKPQEYGQQLQA
jgi:hypothetical protein